MTIYKDTDLTVTDIKNAIYSITDKVVDVTIENDNGRTVIFLENIPDMPDEERKTLYRVFEEMI